MTPRPITDELVCLKQAIDLLKVAEGLVQPENIERYPGAIASVIRTARTLVERTRDAARIRAEIRELQKATAELACIQSVDERAIDAAISARIDACLLEDRKAEIEGGGPR